jgi:hypothetical protein
MTMPDKRTIERARKDKRAGKAPSTQAGEFVREEIDKVRRGKHGARSAAQAIAIGLSEARRAGVALRPPKKGKASERTRRSAEYAYEVGQHKRKARRRPRVARAVERVLEHEPRGTVSRAALSRQTRKAAAKRSASDRSAAARKGARTKGRAGRSEAARKAARTRKAVAARGTSGRKRGGARSGSSVRASAACELAPRSHRRGDLRRQVLFGMCGKTMPELSHADPVGSTVQRHRILREPETVFRLHAEISRQLSGYSPLTHDAIPS